MKRRAIDYAIETAVALFTGCVMIGYAAHICLRGKA
jgi:hypothetical protein